VWYGKYWGRIQGNNKERRPEHENQIPEVYMERVIRACSNEGNLILDPFLGSGTTCTIAYALKRRSIGIEISHKTAKSAFKRIKEGPVRLSNTFEEAITRAFFSVHEGESTDEVIINDSLRVPFIKACENELSKLGLPKTNEFEYNWKLEYLRKQGRLGRVLNRRKRRSSYSKDPAYDLAKNIATKIMEAGLPKTIDKVMCDPHLRQKFDERAKNINPKASVYLVRKAALNLRKRSSKAT